MTDKQRANLTAQAALTVAHISVACFTAVLSIGVLAPALVSAPSTPLVFLGLITAVFGPLLAAAYAVNFAYPAFKNCIEIWSE